MLLPNKHTNIHETSGKKDPSYTTILVKGFKESSE